MSIIFDRVSATLELLYLLFIARLLEIGRNNTSSA